MYEQIQDILDKINLSFSMENLIFNPYSFGSKRLPYHLIYMHVNKINGKFYIGQTCNPYERWGRNGKKYQEDPYFWAAIQKYGWNNFYHYIIETNLTQDQANERESYYISILQAQNKNIGYNIAAGGKMRAGELWKDISYREKTINSFRKARQKTWSDPIMAKYLQDCLQKGVQEFWSNPEKRQERIKEITGAKNPNSKSVINIETGKLFMTISEASQWAGLKSISCIGANCRGQTKSAGRHPETNEKLHWRYAQKGVDYE